MGKSFFLTDFEGVSNVDECADIMDLDAILAKARKNRDILDKMITAIEEQKQIVSEMIFGYKIEWFRHLMYGCTDRYYYYVSILAVPSNPKLRPFRVKGTYTQCYSWVDALNHARELVWDFRKKGVIVEFDETVVK
jgi:hypothetical protein